jgi:hypothetical protein
MPDARRVLLVLSLPAVAAALTVAAGCSKTASETPADVPPTESRPAPSPQAQGQAKDAPPLFADVTAASGIDFTCRNGQESKHYTMIEFLGSGVGLLDYDQDGLLDVFIAGGGHFGPNQEILGHPCRLYRNLGQFGFRDVTAEAGLDKIAFYSHGVAAGDYDDDGWPDLLVTGYGRLALFHNNHGRFEEVTEKAGLVDRRPLHWSNSAAWGDFNHDGKLDFVAAHYADWTFKKNFVAPGRSPGVQRDVPSPRAFEPLLPSLYLNNGDGTFREATVEAGLKPGRGLGIVAVDFNEDGLLDFYQANDLLDNYLYLNQGGGKFKEVGVSMGAAVGETGKPDGSMGVDAADYDGSGHFSIIVTNFQGELEALYRNPGSGPFRHTSTRAGLSALSLDNVGWGVGFFDFDHNGTEDLFICNGHTVHHPQPPATVYQLPVLLKNLYRPGMRPTDVRFEDVTAQAGPYFSAAHPGRSVAFGDLDNDGRVDMVITHVNEPVAVLRNVVTNDNHWLGVRLIGRPQPDAVGARLELEVAGHKLVRAVKGGGSYLASNDRRVVFGLGPARAAGRLTVRWPSGKVQTWDNLPIDRYWDLFEGETAPHEPRPLGRAAANP